MDDFTERIRAMVRQLTRIPTLEDEEDVLQAGIVNSLALAQILTFVEENLGVEVSDEELTADNFRSIGAIGRMVDRLRRLSPAS